jgi:hypothetical protein
MSSHINDNIKSILEKNKIDHYEFPAQYWMEPFSQVGKNKERIHTTPQRS